MNRSVVAVLTGTFTLRFSTGLTGAALIYYLADLPRFGGQEVGPLTVGVLAATFFVAELLLAPAFGVLSDRLGQRPVMQLGPVFGGVAVVLTGLTTHIPLLAGTRLLEGSSTAASVPSILGYVARATADDDPLRGRVVARFELATLAGLGGGLVVAGPIYQAVGNLTFFLNAVIYGLSWVIFRFAVVELPAIRGAGAGVARGTDSTPGGAAWGTDSTPGVAARGTDSTLGVAAGGTDSARGTASPGAGSAGTTAAQRADSAGTTPPSLPAHAGRAGERNDAAPSAHAGTGGAAIPGEHYGVRRYVQVLSSSHVWILAPTWIAVNAVLGIWSSQSIFQLVRRPGSFLDESERQLLMGGFTPVQVSAGLAAGLVVFFIGLLYWGGRFKRYRRTTILAYGVGGGAVAVVFALLLNHSVGQPHALQAVYVLGGAFGLFVLAGATPAALALLADISEAYPRDRGAIMGLYSVFLSLGQIAGSLIGGEAGRLEGFDGILVATLVLLGIALLPLYRLRALEHMVGGPDPASRPAGGSHLRSEP